MTQQTIINIPPKKEHLNGKWWPVIDIITFISVRKGFLTSTNEEKKNLEGYGLLGFFVKAFQSKHDGKAKIMNYFV